MENEIIEMEETTNEMEVQEMIPEESSKGIFGKIVALAAVVGVGAAVYLHKTKDKREAKKIEKLKAKGYIIYHPDEVESEFDDVEPVEESEE